MIQGSPSRLRSPETVMHGVDERVCVLVPRLRWEFFGADDAAFGGDEDFEHCELLPGQRDVAAVAVDLSAERIQTQALRSLAQVACCGRACGRRSEPEHEFSGSNGFVR